MRPLTSNDFHALAQAITRRFAAVRQFATQQLPPVAPNSSMDMNRTVELPRWC